MMARLPEASLFHDRTVLVVEDSFSMRQLLRSLLRQFGFAEILEAADGSDALRRLAEERVDVVVSDWMMEPTDGFGFLTALRQHPDPMVRGLPVVMLTALANEDRVVAARDAGVTEYLIKPVSAAKLEQRLFSVLAKPRPIIATESYVGPDRRRRGNAPADTPRRRLTDRAEALAGRERTPGATTALRDALPNYAGVLRIELARLRGLLAAIETTEGLAFEYWRQVRRVAHDLKGQSSSFGYEAVAGVGGSLERLVGPAVEAPAALTKAGDRRLRAAFAHAEALQLLVDQDIQGMTVETEALIERLAASVSRVHREAAE